MYKYKPVIRKILVTASHFQTKEGKMANVGPSTLPVIIWRNAGSECFLAYLINEGKQKKGATRAGGGWG